MKKIILPLLLFASGIIYAQDDVIPDEIDSDRKPVKERKHELRLDALEAILGPILEVNYEYVLGRYSGVGASLSLNLDSDNGFDEFHKFAFTPYYRQYFFNKKDFGARGLFAEGNLRLAFGESYTYNDIFFSPNDPSLNSGDRTENWTQFGIGFAIGQKWVSRNGFIFEISLGAGRYFGDNGNDDDDDSFYSEQPEFYTRGGFLVGYRF